MATDDADTSDAGQPVDDESVDAPQTGGSSTSDAGSTTREPARVGDYTWKEFLQEHGHGDEVDDLYPEDTEGGLLDRSGPSKPSGSDWDRVSFDPEEHLGFDPDDIEDRLADAAGSETARTLREEFVRQTDPDAVAVAKGDYTWEHFKREYYYDEEGEPPRSDGEVVPFDPEQHLGWEPENTENVLAGGADVGERLSEVVDDKTVTTVGDFDESDLQAVDDVEREDVEAFDEDEFFSDDHGNTTLVNRYDLEKAVPEEKKSHFREENRYWVNKPYAFVIIFHSIKENEKKYYAIEPHLNEMEADLQEFMTGKLRTAIKYSDDEVVVEGSQEDRAEVIERESRRLLERYDIYDSPDRSADGGGMLSSLGGGGGLLASLGLDSLVSEDDDADDEPRELEGIAVRPEPTVLAEDPQTLNEYQVEKLLYHLKRDFIGYERIDPIKHDINVEDISVDGHNAPVFVYHSDYEQVISNIYHGEDELDDFVVKLAQRSGKGISKRNPQVDATLPDGSRAQLTLGKEVSDHGTNYTIRQFKDVPFTPIDLINWNTFSLDEMAFLWLCIENNKSLIFAGGTASGKTTSLNAVSLFIPSNAKIVSIEDTREVELPQRNWIASVTRPSFGEDDKGDVDEFDLLEAALRQRPDYIVMGEVRGEEGRDLFQVMSTGHTSYSTFHADSVGEVLKRFTTDPINVSKTMFTALDLVSIQTQTRVDGHKVRRNKNLTEINHYDAENDEINVQDVYQWQAETDEFLKMGESNTLEEIMFDRGWTHDKLQRELFKREVILAYLIHNELNTYTEVAATIQAFINDPDTILTLIANERLQDSLEDLREMESVLIDIDPEKEELVPRPSPDDETEQLTLDILDRAEDSLFDEYRGESAMGLAGALEDVEEADDEDGRLELPEDDDEDIEFSGELSGDAFQADALDVDESLDESAGGEAPALSGDAEATDEPDDVAGSDEGDGAEAATEDDSPDWLFSDDAAGEELDFEDASGDEPSGGGEEPATPDSGGEEPATPDSGSEEPAIGEADDGKPTDAGTGGPSESPDSVGEPTGDGRDGESGGDEGGDFAFDEPDDGTTEEAASEDGLAFGGDDGPDDGGGVAFDAPDDGDEEESAGEDREGLSFEAPDEAGDGEDLAFGNSDDGGDEESAEEGGEGLAFDAPDDETGDGNSGFAFDEEADSEEDEEPSDGGLAFGTDGGETRDEDGDDG